jgi:hypothetical protein
MLLAVKLRIIPCLWLMNKLEARMGLLPRFISFRAFMESRKGKPRRWC